jgi:hypothetical protein
MPETTRHRRRFQFSLRSLLVLVTACTVSCSWLGVRLRQAERVREALALAREIDGKVNHFESYYYREWFSNPLNDQVLSGVYWVNLHDTQVTDAHLEQFAELRQLASLNLQNTRISDAGLAQLKGLNNLKFLYLEGTKVTDRGLAHLAGMDGLRELYLGGTEVTDAGLVYLEDLRDLRGIYLRNTKVTEEGAKRLRARLPECEILR